jgi:hypothetical protein
MKKSVVLGMLAVSMLGLTACGNNTSKSSNSNSSSSTSTSSAKSSSVKPTKAKAKATAQLLEEANHPMTIKTDKGQLSFYKNYAGVSYDSHNKEQSLVMIASYKVTNNSKKALTAEEIANHTALHLENRAGNKMTEVDQPVSMTSVYKHTKKNEAAIKKLEAAEKEWNTKKIAPGKTAVVASKTAYVVGDAAANQTYFKLIAPATEQGKHLLDTKHETVRLDHAKMEVAHPVKAPVNILK